MKCANGIVRHSKGHNDILPIEASQLALTLEGQVVRLADIIAYVNHDMDDALRAGILSYRFTVPYQQCRREKTFPENSSMVRDLIVETLTAEDGGLHISEIMFEVIADLALSSTTMSIGFI